MNLAQLLHLCELGDRAGKVAVDAAEGQLDDVDAAVAHLIEIGLRQRQTVLPRR